MPMPSDVPAWNTGGANRTEPSAGEKILGWVAGDPVNSSYFNWLLFTVYEWVLFLQGIEGEALTWTALQTFEDGIVASTDVVNGDTITVTANGASGRAIFTEGPVEFDGTGYGLEAVTIRSDSVGLFVSATEGSFFQSNSWEFPAVSINNLDTGGALSLGGPGGGQYPLYVACLSGNGGAMYAEGHGTGPGVYAVGGATGDGLYAESPLGGSFRAGAGAAGGIGTGAAGAGGLIGIGGAGAWGVSAESTGVASLRALRTDSASLPVMDARGTISFDNAAQPAGNLSVKNQLTRDGYAKVLAVFVGNNTITPSIESRQNVTSIAQVIGGGTNGQFTVTFAQDFSTNIYGCNIRCENTGAYLAEVLTKNAGSVVFRFVDSPTNTPQTASALDACRFSLEIYGAQ